MKELRDFRPLPPEPGPCPTCGARRQWNVDSRIVHARAGTYECPQRPVADFPQAALVRLAGREGMN